MSPWFFLIAAGLFEVGFTTFMKLSDNFTHMKYTALFLVCATISFSLLGVAMRNIPLGTAYAVWTGIGAVGTAIIGMIFFADPATLGRMFFLALIISGVIGMKLVSHIP